MSNLRSTLESLAARFAESVIDALRSASLDEITSVASGSSRTRPRAAAAAAEPVAKKRAGGRLPRRTADDIQAMVQKIVDLVAKHPDGLRAEQIRASLDVDAKELPRPLAEAVTSGALTRSGQKRATTYAIGSGGSSARSAKRRGRRPAKRG
jgi:hypothetical protein